MRKTKLLVTLGNYSPVLRRWVNYRDAGVVIREPNPIDIQEVLSHSLTSRTLFTLWRPRGLFHWDKIALKEHSSLNKIRIKWINADSKTQISIVILPRTLFPWHTSDCVFRRCRSDASGCYNFHLFKISVNDQIDFKVEKSSWVSKMVPCSYSYVNVTWQQNKCTFVYA